MKPKKKLGQNFLINEKYISAFVSAVRVSKKDVVVEIGAGTGALTKDLAKKAKKVIAFELDKDLIPILKAELDNFDNVEIINKDFLKVDSQKLHNTLALHSAKVFDDFKLVGSIPYDMASPLIHKLLTLEPRPSSVVLLIQREVAEKITAQPPRATYLSNIVQLLGEVQITDFVPRSAFWPKPKVGGAIIKLVPNAQCLLPKAEIGRFQRLLHKGFQYSRKILRNKFDSEILRSAGIAPTQRAQRLSLKKWVKLYKSYPQHLLKEMGNTKEV
jgi:16S rRNA (adenine1518-N6/adenine1519-N6)-dimethyltransferase